MKPMFTLTGQVVHVYVSPKGISKKTGEEYGGEDKVQIIGDIPVGNGEFRKEMVTLTTDQGGSLEKAVGRTVVAPVAFWARSGTVGYFIPKGAQIALQGQQ
jgi:hypothetical protein